MRVLRYGSVLIRVFEMAQYLETIFTDGTKVPARPEDTDAYRVQAENLGYGANTWAMCRDHEIAHTWLSQKLGQPYSASLWAVAHGSPKRTEKPGEMWAEEELVLAFQRWSNFTGHRFW